MRLETLLTSRQQQRNHCIRIHNNNNNHNKIGATIWHNDWAMCISSLSIWITFILQFYLMQFKHLLPDIRTVELYIYRYHLRNGLKRLNSFGIHSCAYHVNALSPSLSLCVSCNDHLSIWASTMALPSVSGRQWLQNWAADMKSKHAAVLNSIFTSVPLRFWSYYFCYYSSCFSCRLF